MFEPASLFEDFKRAYADEMEKVFRQFSRHSGGEVRFDQEVLSGLLDLAPPGLDEIMALAELVRHMTEGSYDLFVLDTAPTGHALRFLELPDLVRDWIEAFFEILLKYRGVVHVPGASELLVDLSKRAKEIRELFSDAERCECVLVTLHTEMALQEASRLAAALTRLEILVGRLVLNRTLSTTEACPHCRSSDRAQEEVWDRFRERFPEVGIVQIPEWSSGLAGVDRLSLLVDLGRDLGTVA